MHAQDAQRLGRQSAPGSRRLRPIAMRAACRLADDRCGLDRGSARSQTGPPVAIVGPREPCSRSIHRRLPRQPGPPRRRTRERRSGRRGLDRVRRRARASVVDYIRSIYADRPPPDLVMTVGKGSRKVQRCFGRSTLVFWNAKTSSSRPFMSISVQPLTRWIPIPHSQSSRNSTRPVSSEYSAPTTSSSSSRSGARGSSIRGAAARPTGERSRARSCGSASRRS